ncbi:MAG TPA: hypothetical protein VGM56_27170 [Byssovorax sp.]
MSPTPSKLLVAAGLVAAGLSAAPAVLHAAREPRLETLAFLAPLLVFVAAFLASLARSTRRAARRAALVVESVAAIALNVLAPGGFAGVLFVVVAGQAPFVAGAARSTADRGRGGARPRARGRRARALPCGVVPADVPVR